MKGHFTNKDNKLIMEENMLKFISMILSVLMISFPFASMKTNYDVPTVADDVFYSSCQSLYLRPIGYSNSVYLDGETMFQKYEVIYPINADKIVISIESDNITLINDSEITIDAPSSQEFLTISFKIANGQIGGLVISLSAYSDDELILEGKQSSIYVVSNDEGAYYSINSLDHAKKMAGIETPNIDIVECSSRADAESILTTASTNISVSGYIYWNDSNGNIHPAQNVTVEVYDEDVIFDDLIATVTTNDNGYYIATVDTGDGWNEGESFDIYVKVCSKGANITITDSSGDVYEHTSNTTKNVKDGIEKTVYISNTTDSGKSFSVHQAMQYANKFMKNIEGAFLNNIAVSFPDSSQGTSCFSPSDEHIYILEGDAFDWDVLQHEYGHYVQHEFGIADNPGGTHFFNVNHADYVSNKSKGVRLAWAEGWATYFAIGLQTELSLSSSSIPNVGDTEYSDTVDASINYDIETVDDGYLLGEAGEVAVSGVLYDLTDPSSSSDYDSIYFYFSDIWNITKANDCTTLSSLITGIYNAGYTTYAKLRIGNTLTHFKVAANLHDNPSSVYDETPTFSWAVQGGSTKYPNNSFRLSFYDEQYNLILTVYTTGSTYTLTSSQWSTVASASLTIYCCVETSQTNSPYTGAYYSNLIHIEFP